MLSFARSVPRSILIAGGAGALGTNLAAHLLAHTDARITVLDRFSRAGSQLNLAWLRGQAAHGRLHCARGDLRMFSDAAEAVRHADEVYCLASQIDNAAGIENVCEAAQRMGRRPIVLCARESGTSDAHALGNSSEKAVEEMIQERAHLCGIAAVLLRLDSVAGPRQFAEEQGAWVARLVYSALSGKPFTICGNGRQVHDVLHISDVVAALLAARAYIGVTAGKIYNVSGGSARTISESEMVNLVERVCHRSARVRFEALHSMETPGRSGNHEGFSADTGWMPRRSLEQTVRDIAAFWYANRTGLENEPDVPSYAYPEAA